MKRLLLFLLPLALMTLMACSNHQANSGDDVPNDTIAEDSLTQVESVGEVSLKTKTYSAHQLFKCHFGRKVLYHENTISIDWVEDSEGFDQEALENALAKFLNMKDHNIKKYVNDWAKNTFADVEYGDDLAPVAEKDEETPDDADDDMNNESEDEIINYPQYNTDCSLEVNYIHRDDNLPIFAFRKSIIENNGCGLGSCIFMGYDNLTFDYNLNRVITLYDIIANESIALRELKKQQIGAEDYACISGLDDLKELPADFYITGDVIYCCFSKYEIACGMDGCPSIGFSVKKHPEMLTDYGKALFGLDP